MSQMPDRLDRFDSSLEEVKRENRQNRRALDHILREITAREEETPRQRFACDLLSILAANAELVQGVPGADTWKDLPEMAEKCLEAAGKIYPEPAGPEALPALDELFAHLRGYPLGDVAVADHEAENDDEPLDPGAHPGVMLSNHKEVK